MLGKQPKKPKANWFVSKIFSIGNVHQKGRKISNATTNSSEVTRIDIYSKPGAFNIKTSDNNYNENFLQTKHENETASNVMGQFMDTTSAHGFFQVKFRRNLITKIFWICVLMLAFGGLGYHLATLVMKYLSYGHEETTEMVRESPLFPDVTVCNMDAISADRYWEDEQRVRQESASYWNLTAEWNDLKKMAERGGQKTFDVDDILASPGLFANLPKEFRKSISYRLRDLITSCTFDGQLCNWSLFRLYEHSEFFNCYTFQVSNDTYVRAGPESGLTLLLFIGDQGDTLDKAFTPYSSILGSRGWRVVVHEQNTLPAVFVDGIDILPGMSTSLALSSTQISRLPSPYSGCVENSFLPNTSYKTTQETCRKICMRRAIEIHCGCVPVEISPYHYPNDVYCLTYDPNDPIKIFVQKECEENIRQDNTTKEMSDGLKECEQHQCNWRCEEVVYNIQTTASVFPTPEVMAFFYTLYIYNNPDREELLAWKQFNDPVRFIKGEHKTAEDYLYNGQSTRGKTVMTPNVTAWIANSFARVNIYFKDVTVTRKIQAPSYGLMDLMADIGGVLGLWVGVSIITIFEFLALLSELVMLPCHLPK